MHRQDALGWVDGMGLQARREQCLAVGQAGGARTMGHCLHRAGAQGRPGMPLPMEATLLLRTRRQKSMALTLGLVQR